jgi:thiol-disulfide isomerase/thioredoxin
MHYVIQTKLTYQGGNMVATPSTMVSLGTPAPEFSLPDTISGQTMSLDELKSDVATVVMFICNHCPYVKHIQEGLIQIAQDYQPEGVSFIAISSNDVEQYPEDGPEAMKEVAQRLGYPFPYLFDETQEVAKAYSAVCTPDIFIFDEEMKLVYRGQFDDARPSNNISVTGKDVRKAIDALLNDQPVDTQQKPSVGCSIKWKQ